MAKKTRKVMKQQSQQRAIQQAQANINTVNNAPAAAEPVKVATSVRVAKTESVTAEQEFAFVKSDVRKSLTLAGVFIVAMIALSFVIH
jgi:hypothetical protein